MPGGAELTRQEIEAWQLQKLNETLILARSGSAFYKKHLAGMPQVLSSLDEFRRFPFTGPEDIRRNPLRLLCVSQDQIRRVVTLQSSGTTGEPKRLYFTAGDQELTRDFFGIGMSTFVRPGEQVLILLPGERAGSVGDLLRSGLERLGIVPIPYGPVRDPAHALETLNRQKADCLAGSPTQVLGMALRWQPEMYRAPQRTAVDGLRAGGHGEDPAHGLGR